MKLVKTLSTAIVFSALLVGLTGCQKSEGPAENAGESLDEATEQLGEEIEDTGEAIQDAAQGSR